MRAFLLTLCLVAAPLVGAPQALAAPHVASSIATWGRALPGASVAGELKATQGKVDGTLKQRRQRMDAWQKAAAARDRAAQDVQRMKRAGADSSALEAALAKALDLDEKAARARARLLASEAEAAKGGAELLRLYDALLVERRRAVEALDATDPQRGAAVIGYRDLAAQRDAVRRALLPVLQESVAQDAPQSVDLEPRAGDDVEALLAKADLARDLEDRAVRQAAAVARRMRELEEERAVARDVSGMLGRSQLFDEEDRRLLVIRQDLQSASATTLSGAQRARPEDVATSTAGADADATDDAPLAPVNPTLLSAPTGPAPFSQTEQGFLGPQTDASVAGLLSSSSTSLDELRALELKLRTSARTLRGKSEKLKSEARTRAHD
jgi:Skp family chaperone for outer membrane proteins